MSQVVKDRFNRMLDSAIVVVGTKKIVSAMVFAKIGRYSAYIEDYYMHTPNTMILIVEPIFTNCISCQPYWFYNFTQLWQFNCEMKLKVNLWLDYSYFVFGMGQYTLFPIDFNGKPEIFLKH